MAEHLAADSVMPLVLLEHDRLTKRHIAEVSYFNSRVQVERERLLNRQARQWQEFGRGFRECFEPIERPASDLNQSAATDTATRTVVPAELSISVSDHSTSHNIGQTTIKRETVTMSSFQSHTRQTATGPVEIIDLCSTDDDSDLEVLTPTKRPAAKPSKTTTTPSRPVSDLYQRIRGRSTRNPTAQNEHIPRTLRELLQYRSLVRENESKRADADIATMQQRPASPLATAKSSSAPILARDRSQAPSLTTRSTLTARSPFPKTPRKRRAESIFSDLSDSDFVFEDDSDDDVFAIVHPLAVKHTPSPAKKSKLNKTPASRSAFSGLARKHGSSKKDNEKSGSRTRGIANPTPPRPQLTASSAKTHTPMNIKPSPSSVTTFTTPRRAKVRAQERIDQVLELQALYNSQATIRDAGDKERRLRGEDKDLNRRIRGLSLTPSISSSTAPSAPWPAKPATPTQQPISPYDFAKWTADRLLGDRYLASTRIWRASPGADDEEDEIDPKLWHYENGRIYARVEEVDLTKGIN